MGHGTLFTSRSDHNPYAGHQDTCYVKRTFRWQNYNQRM